MERRFAEIGIVIYPGVQQAAVFGITDILLLAGRLASQNGSAGGPDLAVSHWRMEQKTAGPTRVFGSDNSSGGAPDVLVLPPGFEPAPNEVEISDLARWLSGAYLSGTTLASVCKASLLLAKTGLLAGRTISAHWTIQDELRSRYPQIVLDTNRSMIDDGDIVTVSGLMQWPHLSLHLVSRFLDRKIMEEIADRFLIDLSAFEASRRRFARRLNHRDETVRRVEDWLLETKAKDVDLAALVAKSGLEERTLLRRFKRATGVTTTEYCQRVRVDVAAELLRETHASFEHIAWQIGYRDAASFRKVFTRIAGSSPAEYRRAGL